MMRLWFVAVFWVAAVAAVAQNADLEYRRSVLDAMQKYKQKLETAKVPAADRKRVEAELQRLEQILKQPQTTTTTSTAGDTASTMAVGPGVAPVSCRHVVAAGKKPGTAYYWLETDGTLGVLQVQFKLTPEQQKVKAWDVELKTANVDNAQSLTGVVVKHGDRQLGAVPRTSRHSLVRVPLAPGALPATCNLSLVGGGTDGVAVLADSIRLRPHVGLPPKLSGTDVYFADDFADDSSWQHWQTPDNNARIHNGWIQFSGGNHTGLGCKVKTPVDNVVIEFRGVATKNGFHCHFKPYNVNFGAYDNSRCAAGIWPKPFHQVRVEPSYKSGVAQVFRIESNGGMLRGFIDGKKVVEFQVPGERKLEPETFLFTAYSSMLKIDWIRISKLK